eukprot:335-Lingulodinium_polyedra.AAC.1
MESFCARVSASEQRRPMDLHGRGPDTIQHTSGDGRGLRCHTLRGHSRRSRAIMATEPLTLPLYAPMP